MIDYHSRLELKSKKKEGEMKKTVFLLFIFFILLFTACEKGTFIDPQNDETEETASVSFNFPIPQSISSQVVFAEAMVSAADMDTIVAELTVMPNNVKGTINKIPAGLNRKFEVSTYDSDSSLTYYGFAFSHVAAGAIQTLQITLYPVDSTGTVIITGVFAPFPQANGKIVFYQDSLGYRDIYIMNPDASEKTKLTNTPQMAKKYPRLSPNKQKIVYSREDQSVYRLFIMDVDGSNNYELDFLPGYNMASADWAPSGEQLVVPAKNNDDCEIYIFDLNSGSVTQLTNNTYDDWVPKWSPDGNWIAYQSNETGVFKIILMHPDGTGKHVFMPNSGLEEKFPQFSPDGNKIVFYGRDWSTWDLFTVNMNGTNLQRLTNTPSVDECYGNWSPDMQHILFARFDGITRGLYLYNLINGGMIKLLDIPDIEEDFPHWR